MKPAISEKQWQGQVLELAALYSWAAYHTFDSRRSAAGFPDLVLVRPPRILFVELKTDKGALSPAQHGWLGALRACGLYAEVWRPRDFDEAHRQLTGR